MEARSILFLLLALIVAGCGTASVSPEVTAAPVNASRPSMIAVYEFAVSSSEVTQNQSILQKMYRAVALNAEQQEEGQLQTGHEAAKDLSDDLVTKLAALGFNAQPLARGTLAPEGALIIDGQFLNVDEGNRLRRLVIGFGAGASKLDTQVNVLQVANGEPNQLLDFKTHADSGKMPGAAVTMGAGAAAQGGATVAAGVASAGMAGAKTYRSTMGFLADSTAKQIVAYFSQYAAGQSWIRQDQVQKATLDQNAQ